MMVGGLLLGSCTSEPGGPPPPPPPPVPPPPVPPPPPPPTPPEVMLAAGDIAGCNQNWDEATARIVDTIPGTVAVLGDAGYPSGTASEYANCYAPTWGRHLNRTRPAAGNHDYLTPGATGYFGYFGSAAGAPGKGWYSYGLGKWHVVVLNSNFYEGGPAINEGSEQLDWLRANLASSPRLCTMVYFHHPRWSSSTRGANNGLDAVWRVMYNAGVDLVLNGHEHFYERMAPQNPSGAVDQQYGIRQFISGMAGTGATSGYPFGTTHPASEMRQNIATGILKLELDSASYTWRFITPSGFSFTDSGSGSCHGAPPNPVPLAALERRHDDAPPARAGNTHDHP